MDKTASGSTLIDSAAAGMHSFPINLLQRKATVFLNVKWYIVTAYTHGCDTYKVLNLCVEINLRVDFV